MPGCGIGSVCSTVVIEPTHAVLCCRVGHSFLILVGVELMMTFVVGGFV